MADQTLALGTLFTADISQFLRNVDLLRKEMGRLNSAMISSNKHLKAQARQAGMFTANVNRATTAMTKHARAQAAVGKQISKVESGLKRLKAAFSVIAAYGIAGGVVGGILMGLREGTDEIVQFDQALKNLQAITGATQAEIAGMGEEILKVARTTKFSTTEVADGMVLLGQAGLSAEEAMSAIQATSDLATGTITDFKQTADLLTTTLRAFSLNASESTRISDVMANAINRSKLTVDKLRIAFNFVGASAAQSNLSLEQTAATMMVLANNGLRASTIGTGMRQVLARLLAPSRKLRESFKEHGIELDKVNPRVVGFEEAIKNLVPTMYDTERKTVDMGKAVELFGLRGAQAAAVLIKGFTSGEYHRMLDNTFAVGTAAEMAATQVEGLALIFKNVADRAGTVAVTVGDAGVSGALRIVGKALQGFLDLLETFIRSSAGKFITQLTLITSAILTLGAAFRYVATSAALAGFASSFIRIATNVSLAQAVILKFGVVLRALPFIGVATAIGFLITAYIRMRQRSAELIEQLNKEALQNKQNLETLTQYKESLEALDPASKEYEATIKRLASAYKLLGTEAELLNMRQDELIAKMKAHQFNQFRVGLANTIFAMRELTAQFDTQVDRLSRHAKAMKTNLKDLVNRDVIDRTRQWNEEMDALKERFGAQLKKTVEYKRIVRGVEEGLASYINLLMRMVEAGALSEEQAKAFYDELQEEGGIIADLAKNKFPELEDAMARYRNREQDKISETLKEMSELGAEYRALYDSLSALDKLDFLERYTAHVRKLAALEKSLKNIGATQEEIDAALALKKADWLSKYDAPGLIQFMALQRKFLSMQARLTGDEVGEARAQHVARLKDIEAFLEKATVKYTGHEAELARIHKWGATLRKLNDEQLTKDLENIYRRRADQLLEIERWYTGERAKLSVDETARAEERYRAEEARLKAAFEKRKAILEAQERDITGLERRYQALRELNAKNKTIALARIEMDRAEKLLELEEAKNAALLAERKRAAGRDETAIEEIKVRERALEIEHAEKILALRKAFLKKVQAAGIEDKEAVIAAEKAVYDAQAKLSKLRASQYIADRKAETGAEVRELKERLKYAEKYGEEYYRILERLNALGAATDAREQAELDRKKAKLEGLWASFKYGVEQARRQAKDWGDTMIEIGSRIEDTIATNMTDAILDFAEGAKSAKEAFQDFAKSTVRWLAQIIIKQAILNALQGYGGYEGGASTGAGGGVSAIDFHKGGKAGRDGTRHVRDPALFQFAPRLHKGLRANEFPAILQRGEEVIPKNRSGKPFGDVQVIVNNNSGQQVQASPEGVKWDGSNMIVSVVIDAYQRNKMGLRDMMRGPA